MVLSVPRPTTSVSSGNLLEIKFLVAHPRPTESKTLGSGPEICVVIRALGDLGICWTLKTTVSDEHESSIVEKLSFCYSCRGGGDGGVSIPWQQGSISVNPFGLWTSLCVRFLFVLFGGLLFFSPAWFRGSLAFAHIPLIIYFLRA